MKLEVNKAVENKYSHFYISTINNQYWKNPNYPFLFIACILPLFSSPITTPKLLERFPTRKGKNIPKLHLHLYEYEWHIFSQTHICINMQNLCYSIIFLQTHFLVSLLVFTTCHWHVFTTKNCKCTYIFCMYIYF